MTEFESDRPAREPEPEKERGSEQADGLAPGGEPDPQEESSGKRRGERVRLLHMALRWGWRAIELWQLLRDLGFLK
ncbi:hypothetical protein ACFVTF_21810 [Kitasatospora sp. NPDC057940]|uniref:hypothetical protein n=1 Tax=Kitasatospora sp. NPDC057940 TaxID=3346285 RepID=UPI0036DCBE5B